MKSNKSFFIFCASIIGILVIALLIIWIISLTKKNYTTYEKVIEKMETATIEYYKKHEKPLENGEHYLAYETLVEAGYIKPLNKLLKNGDSCSAHVIVTNNDARYSYTPYLNCVGDNGYSSTELYKMLTDSNNIVNSGSGLYHVGSEYYYRGEVTNNYIQLGIVTKNDKKIDNIWRIISIESDGTIKIRNTTSTNSSYSWDDRYNVNFGYNYGYNTFELSRLKYRNKLVAKKLCVAPRIDDDPSKDGSTECSVMSNDTYVVGTITPYEYMRISLDDNCKRTVSNSCANYNYLANGNQNVEWTITAFNDNNYQSYSFNGAKLSPDYDYSEKYLYLTAYLSDKTFYVSGNGTLNSPYVIR